MKRKVTLAVVASVVALMPVMAQAANKLIVKDAGGTVDKFVATDTGRIGINVTTPEAGIHLKATAYPDNAIRIEGNEASAGSGLLLYNKRTTGLPLTNDRLGFLFFGSLDGTTPYHPAGVEARADGDWTTTSTPSYFGFWTAPAGQTTRYERMRIASTGYVGMGTTTPAQRLEVNGGVRLNTATAKPTCTSSIRGTLWYTQGVAAAKDTLEVCAKDAADSYSWRLLY